MPHREETKRIPAVNIEPRISNLEPRRAARNRRRMAIRGVDTAGGANLRPGQSAGYVWKGGEQFYGTRIGPEWYQSGTRVAGGCRVPFSALRTLMQFHPYGTLKPSA